MEDSINNNIPNVEDKESVLNESTSTEANTPVTEANTPVTEANTPVMESTPTAPAESQYGAPSMLDEDMIPLGFGLDSGIESALNAQTEKESAKQEKEAEIARKKAEKEAAKEAKKQEKEAKKKAKIAALIAKVEAEAEQAAIREIKEESGEDYVPPQSAVAQQSAQPQKKGNEQSAAPAAEEAPAQPLAPLTKEEKKHQKYQNKLRKKYKMDRDPLLNDHIAVPGFVIAKGENVIRSYSCLSTAKGDGILCLTNRRLLVDAGERSEVPIDMVSGIKFSKYAKFSFIKFLFWLIFFGLGALMLLLPHFHASIPIPAITGKSWKSWFTYLFYPCGGVSVLISIPLFFTMLKKTFYFYIYAREDTPFLECKSKAYAKRERKGKVYKYMISKAGSESEKAARELGALIIEAKEGRYDD